MTASTPPPAEEPGHDHAAEHTRREGLLALRNGAKLAASMILTALYLLLLELPVIAGRAPVAGLGHTATGTEAVPL